MVRKKREPFLDGTLNGPQTSTCSNSKHTEERDTLCGNEPRDCLACGQTLQINLLFADISGKLLTRNLNRELLG